MKIIKLENIEKVYMPDKNPFTAINGINLTVQKVANQCNRIVNIEDGIIV